MTDETPTLGSFLRTNAVPIGVALAGFLILTAIFAIGDPAIGIPVGILVLAAGVLTHWLRNRPFDRSQRHTTGSVLMSGIIGAVAVLLVIQVIPYGRDHSNPPVTAEPAWDSSTTRDLAVRACFDCHSNEVHWPWYSNVAPFSWMTQRHVDEGRSALNLSEMDRGQHEADEAAETVIEGEMPPFYYTLTHSSARLDDTERRQLVDGLIATLGGEYEGGDDHDDDHDDDHEDDD